MRMSNFTTAVVWTLAVLFTPAIVLLGAIVVVMVVEYFVDRYDRKHPETAQGA